MGVIMNLLDLTIKGLRDHGLMTAVAAMILLGASGCQSAGRIFYRPRAAQADTGSYSLAANATTQPAASTQPATTGPATQPALLFSSPRAEVRQMVLLALFSDVPVSDSLYDAGLEAAQNFTPGGIGTQITGRGGISAPQPVAVSAVNSRPGIINTVLALLPPADPVNNILNAGFNPAGGSDGINALLLRLGFDPAELPPTREQSARSIQSASQPISHPTWQRLPSARRWSGSKYCSFVSPYKRSYATWR